MTQFIKNACKLSLQICGEDGMCDRPADDGKMLGPYAAWFHATKFSLEPEETTPNPIAISVDRPTRSFLLKGLPVLITRIAISDLRGIDHPSKCVVPCWRTVSNVCSHCSCQSVSLRYIKTMLKAENSPVRELFSSMSRKFSEVVFKALLPMCKVHSHYHDGPGPPLSRHSIILQRAKLL